MTDDDEVSSLHSDTSSAIVDVVMLMKAYDEQKPLPEVTLCLYSLRFSSAPPRRITETNWAFLLPLN